MANQTNLGVQLDLAGPTNGGAGLTQDVYVAQAAHVFHVGAAGDLAIWVEATADNATALSAIAFKLQTSYDGTSWADVATDKADGTSSGQVDQPFAVAAGATTHGWLLTKRHRLSGYARLLAKGTGGATKAGDRARASAKAA